MKSKIIFLATLVAVLFTTQISATVRTTPLSDGTNVNFSTIDKTLKISVRNVKAEPVSIFLEDTEGSVWSAKRWSRSLILSNLINWAICPQVSINSRSSATVSKSFSHLTIKPIIS